ncbi:DUF1834 family protein [Serratia symbiotica]|uniref:phage protein Gp37 n=1 Tax=Serratia symbiotica TaxID=138074 RepID=UPI001D589202|nr:phage protein Gp37 [Serratia symbiotica]NIG88532.1 DUF1834 family protein [Serratia symbiotica]USS96219.1 DUF1834 family protein [Serratia symbiotica]
MINETELAMIERLRVGLGQMVKEVSSYGGELDDVGAIARALPVACHLSGYPEHHAGQYA